MEANTECIEIILGGKRRTMDVSLSTWDVARQRLGVSWPGLSVRFSGKNALSAFRTLITCGIVANDRNNGRPDSVTEDQVTEWLMSNTDELTEISRVIQNAAFTKNALKVLNG